jgi:hypothetical protein
MELSFSNCFPLKDFNILNLHDHKGTLLVVWLSKPSDDAKEFITELWSALECEPNTQHTTIKDIVYNTL